SGFDAWISSEIETLENDARFHFLVDLRNAALKDFPIEPNKGDVTIEIGGVSAHAAAGLPALMDCASLEGIPPCDNSTPARAAIRYFLDHSPWPEEDMVQFAEQLFEKLKALVDGARPR